MAAGKLISMSMTTARRIAMAAARITTIIATTSITASVPRVRMRRA